MMHSQSQVSPVSGGHDQKPPSHNGDIALTPGRRPTHILRVNVSHIDFKECPSLNQRSIIPLLTPEQSLLQAEMMGRAARLFQIVSASGLKIMQGNLIQIVPPGTDMPLCVAVAGADIQMQSGEPIGIALLDNQIILAIEKHSWAMFAAPYSELLDRGTIKEV